MATDNKVYDDYANPYDFVLHWTLYRKLQELHLNCCREADPVLDFGCGTGNQTVELLKAGKTVHAIDINPTMMKCVFDKLSTDGKELPKLHLHLMSVEQVDFPDQMFGAVTSMNVIYNVPRPKQAMKEAFRVLKPGGVFSLSGPSDQVDLDQLMENLEEEMQTKGLYNPQTAEAIRTMRQANDHLVQNATFFSVIELRDILLKEIGFREILDADISPYLGQAYFVAARK